MKNVYRFEYYIDGKLSTKEEVIKHWQEKAKKEKEENLKKTFKPIHVE